MWCREFKENLICQQKVSVRVVRLDFVGTHISLCKWVFPMMQVVHLSYSSLEVLRCSLKSRLEDSRSGMGQIVLNLCLTLHDRYLRETFNFPSASLCVKGISERPSTSFLVQLLLSLSQHASVEFASKSKAASQSLASLVCFWLFNSCPPLESVPLRSGPNCPVPLCQPSPLCSDIPSP